MTRYHWTEPTGSPIHVELIDDQDHDRVAVIIGDHSRIWYWSRYTSQAKHGAPPLSGTSLTLEEAKRAVLNGLSNEQSD